MFRQQCVHNWKEIICIIFSLRAYPRTPRSDSEREKYSHFGISVSALNLAHSLNKTRVIRPKACHTYEVLTDASHTRNKIALVTLCSPYSRRHTKRT